MDKEPLAQIRPARRIHLYRARLPSSTLGARSKRRPDSACRSNAGLVIRIGLIRDVPYERRTQGGSGPTWFCIIQ
uniref:Pheromone phb3.2 n=1 Tax=Coprinopsis cinerea TaxID=5346 RepID=Q875K4_COPCI|nr:pheromone phb3.2 [Coprinopsis cinerea]